jgi:hypothetical protein
MAGARYLDVSVNVALAVQILERLERLLQNGGDRGLLEAVLEIRLHDVEARPAGHVGHHHPHAPVHHEGAVRLHQVGMADQAHRHRLAPDVVLPPNRHLLSAKATEITMTM